MFEIANVSIKKREGYFSDGDLNNPRAVNVRNSFKIIEEIIIELRNLPLFMRLFKSLLLSFSKEFNTLCVLILRG